MPVETIFSAVFVWILYWTRQPQCTRFDATAAISTLMPSGTDDEDFVGH